MYRRHCHPLLFCCLLWPIAVVEPGCSASEPPGDSSTPLPRFVYPSEPAIVGVEELRAALLRLDAPVLLWVFEQTDCETTVRSMAEQRDRLRSGRASVLGLYIGPPDTWRTRVLPLLRTADANFPCAVLNPADRPAVCSWLRETDGEELNGVYALSRTGRLLARSEAGRTLSPGELSRVSDATIP